MSEVSETLDEAGLSDTEARLRALTDFDSTLIVEAGAGTGKTSLLAGRLSLLLASGIAPESVVAITFTELAASELAERVQSYVSRLLAGDIPTPLAAALPDGLSVPQTQALTSAAVSIDRLTTGTIHSFCQTLIRGYAVEADIDPGAQVMDADAASLAFDRVFDHWLTRRLSVPPRPDDPVAILTHADPRGVVALFGELARFRHKHRSAHPLAADLSGRPDLELAGAVADLRKWSRAAPCEPGSAGLLDQWEQLAGFYADTFATEPNFAELWRLAHPPFLKAMRWKSSELLRPKVSNGWCRAGGATDGPRLDAEFMAGFDRIDASYRRLLGQVSGALVAQMSAELDEVLADYAAFKRAAAVLDFEDLLERASALLRGHETVRAALSARFAHVLVDEFQDTDPVQCDIIFRLSGLAAAPRWQDVPQRPGALFLVGDPKQALYGFRGAEVTTYDIAKQTVLHWWPDNLLEVTANFRSAEDILTYVNACFAAPLSAPSQPGYEPLVATRAAARHDLAGAVKITVRKQDGDKVAQARLAEADRVADVCLTLIGGLQMRDESGAAHPVRPGDIALLAPTRTDLWIYERALRSRGVPFASHAGKTFFRRQETQDLITLTRVLADANDTLAFGALLRGPLVGLTDEALLDIVEALPDPEGGGPRRFSILTPTEHIADPNLAAFLGTLRSLRRKLRFTTPSQLLAEAVERLRLRAIFTRRDPRHAPAVQANVDAFLERASRYGVRGMRRMAQDLTAALRRKTAAADGRIDVDGDAVEIVTIHSAKGLEWPIVIAINASGPPHGRDPFVHRGGDDTLHWMIGEVAAPGLAEAVTAVTEAQARERARLWYVACTRAQDLLIVPHVEAANDMAYSKAVDLSYGRLPELDLSGLIGVPAGRPRDPPNTQDAAAFEGETILIEAVSKPIIWVRPSDHDPDRLGSEERVEEDVYETGEAIETIDGGRIRGLLLHKLIEEVLGEGLVETQEALEARARALVGQMDLSNERAGEVAGAEDAAELARTTLATLAFPEIAVLRPFLVPEFPLYALVAEAGDSAPIGGRADAIAVEEGCITAVLDWKSDQAPTSAQVQGHIDQIRLYLAATGAPRGALVYMSLGHVRWVEGPDC